MSCQCGCGRLIHMVLDGRGLERQLEKGDLPSVPVDGMPHITRRDGDWVVVVGKAGAPTDLFMPALKHALVLREIWKTMHMVVVPAQTIEYRRVDDQTSWNWIL